MIQSVLFDLDGTLLDVYDFVLGAFEHSLSKHHKDIPTRKDISTHVGKPITEMYQILSGEEQVGHFIDTHREFQFANLSLVKPFPHAIEVLTKIREKGIKIAVVTSRIRSSVDLSMNQAGITKCIDYTVALDEVEKPKPDPEALFKALTHFAVEPKHAMMIGDTHIDIEAGKNAGVKTVAVTHGFQGEKIREADPDNVINNLQELIPLLK